MPLHLGLTERRHRFETSTSQFGAEDRSSGDSFLIPDAAVYDPLLSGSLHPRELTLSDPLQGTMLTATSHKSQTGHGRQELSRVHGQTHISPAKYMDRPAVWPLGPQAARGFVCVPVGPH